MATEPAGPGAWINGELISCDFSLTIETERPEPWFDSSLTIPTEPLTVERTITLADRTVYDRFVQAEDGQGTVTITREGPRRPGRRCLWGWRKGYIQFGSAADQPSLCTITIPKVRFA